MDSRLEYMRAWRAANHEHYQAWQAEYRERNRERLAEGKREWYRQNAERIREKARRRRQEDGDTLREINRRVTRMTERDPVKVRAHTLVAAAIRRGELVPEACERCGVSEKCAVDGRRMVHAHHDDHSKPLEVRWLCVDCHALKHRRVA